MRLPAGQVELVEEDLLELLGAAQVELVADRGVDVLRQPVDGLAEGPRQLGQRLAVEGHARGLHVRQHRHQRQLQLVEDAAQAGLGLEGDLEGLLGGAHGGGLDGGLGHGVELARLGQGDVEPLGADVASDWLRRAALRM